MSWKINDMLRKLSAGIEPATFESRASDSTHAAVPRFLLISTFSLYERKNFSYIGGWAMRLVQFYDILLNNFENRKIIIFTTHVKNLA